ncbi:hypothetical protein [Vibrio phage phiKT1028]|nr:hypothetical protein [Vibrio phage phiKT1028]
MSSYLLASVDYNSLTTYVNSLYDLDNWVLTTELLGTHIATHIASLNDQGEDPDPLLTDYLVVDRSFYTMYVPVMLDKIAFTITGDNGVVCDCPLIVLVERMYYNHFYRH